MCSFFFFPPFGRGKWRPARFFGVRGKICNYIGSKKQKLTRFRKLEAPNDVRECRESGKTRQNSRKVCEKLGSRNGEPIGLMVIHLTRAFRQPCHGSVAPRTPILRFRVREKFCQQESINLQRFPHPNGQKMYF